MSLNTIERYSGRSLRYFAESVAMEANLVKVIELELRPDPQCLRKNVAQRI